MGLNKLAYQGQTDAQPIALVVARSWLGLAEQIENLFDIRRSNADAVIDDIESSQILGHAEDNLNASITLGEFQCVMQQIPDDLF
ncbi:hypothetical protein D3C77_706340 [compost metagenome]